MDFCETDLCGETYKTISLNKITVRNIDNEHTRKNINWHCHEFTAQSIRA